MEASTCLKKKKKETGLLNFPWMGISTTWKQKECLFASKKMSIYSKEKNIPLSTVFGDIENDRVWTNAHFIGVYL